MIEAHENLRHAVSLSTTQMTSAAWQQENAILGALETPATMNGTTFTFLAGSSLTASTFLPVYDSDGAAVSLSVSSSAARAYSLPADVMTHKCCKLVADRLEKAARVLTVVTKTG